MEPILYFMKKIHAFGGGKLYANLLGMTLVSLLDGIGLLLLLPLLSVAGITEDVPLTGESGAAASAMEALREAPPSVSLLLLFGAYAALIALQSLVQRQLALRDTSLHAGFINYIRLEIYRAILQADWRFLVKRRASDLVHALTDELGRVTGGTYMFLQFLASLVFTLIQIGIAFWVSFEMTLFVLGCGLFIGLLSRTRIAKARRLGMQTSELGRSYIGGITDQLAGIKEIKSNMLEASRIGWLRQWCRLILEERVAHARVRMNSQFVYKISAGLMIAAFLYVSVVFFHTEGPRLLLVVLVFSRLWPRFTGIQTNLEQIAAAAPAFQSLMELQAACIDAQEIQEGADRRITDPLKLKEALECRDVSFRYGPEDERYALHGIHLLISPGQMTAIVGRSGAGKSTLADLLMGLLQPESGQVLVDGAPVTGDRLLSLRRAIGYVPQEPLLFNGSIRDNLLLVDPEAREEQLWEALSFASAADFVRALPQGLDTPIGDRGTRLSGGERQRIVLARAILRRPSILVLDEATSALDAENEALIREALNRLRGRVTLIVIAHRMSTIRGADQVIVLDRGTIVQRGAFSQLAGDRGGLFARLIGELAKEPNLTA